MHYNESGSTPRWPVSDDLIPVKAEARNYWLFASTNRVQHTQPEFVETTNSGQWLTVSVAELDNLVWTNSSQPISVEEAQFGLERTIHQPVDLIWLWRGKPNHAASLVAGTNLSGGPLIITNAPPEHGYYWMLSSSPPRYVLITNAPPEHGNYAASFGDQFTLWCDGKWEGTFVLPRYTTHEKQTVLRVALTPLAAAADTAIVGVELVGAVVALGAGPE